MRADAGDKAVGDPPLLGDLNGDGQVGILDAGLLQAKLGLSPVTPPGGDLNVDQLVNRGDVVVLLGAYGPSNAQPSAPAAPQALLVDVALAEDTALANDAIPIHTTSRSMRMLATRHRRRAVDVALGEYRPESQPAIVRHDRLWLRVSPTRVKSELPNPKCYAFQVSGLVKVFGHPAIAG